MKKINIFLLIAIQASTLVAMQKTSHKREGKFDTIFSDNTSPKKCLTSYMPFYTSRHILTISPQTPACISPEIEWKKVLVGYTQKTEDSYVYEPYILLNSIGVSEQAVPEKNIPKKIASTVIVSLNSHYPDVTTFAYNLNAEQVSILRNFKAPGIPGPYEGGMVFRGFPTQPGHFMPIKTSSINDKPVDSLLGDDYNLCVLVNAFYTHARGTTHSQASE